eukprot:gnl/Trimastix_PCT/1990.p1 GENE.gnl/Trimastix_PCT/1990~~gnl/Trimastix_PCT/1990.p1  ORF type:complete len:1773 (-),score=151.85 gnl/Trimastix_PCT/1990:23-5341(-)
MTSDISEVPAPAHIPIHAVQEESILCGDDPPVESDCVSDSVDESMDQDEGNTHPHTHRPTHTQSGDKIQDTPTPHTQTPHTPTPPPTPQIKTADTQTPTRTQTPASPHTPTPPPTQTPTSTHTLGDVNADTHTPTHIHTSETDTHTPTHTPKAESEAIPSPRCSPTPTPTPTPTLPTHIHTPHTPPPDSPPTHTQGEESQQGDENNDTHTDTHTDIHTEEDKGGSKGVEEQKCGVPSTVASVISALSPAVRKSLKPPELSPSLARLFDESEKLLAREEPPSFAQLLGSSTSPRPSITSVQNTDAGSTCSAHSNLTSAGAGTVGDAGKSGTSNATSEPDNQPDISNLTSAAGAGKFETPPTEIAATAEGSITDSEGGSTILASNHPPPPPPKITPESYFPFFAQLDLQKATLPELVKCCREVVDPENPSPVQDKLTGIVALFHASLHRLQQRAYQEKLLRGDLEAKCKAMEEAEQRARSMQVQTATLHSAFHAMQAQLDRTKQTNTQLKAKLRDRLYTHLHLTSKRRAIKHSHQSTQCDILTLGTQAYLSEQVDELTALLDASNEQLQGMSVRYQEVLEEREREGERGQEIKRRKREEKEEREEEIRVMQERLSALHSDLTAKTSRSLQLQAENTSLQDQLTSLQTQLTQCQNQPPPTLHTPTQPPQTAPTQAFPMHPADHLSGNGSPLVKHLPHSPHSGGAQSMSFPVPLHVTEPHPSSPLSLHPSTHTLAQPFSPEPKTPLGRPGPPTPTHTPTHPQPHPQLSVSHTESEESIPGASLASHTPRDADSHHPNGTSHTRGHTQVTTGTTSLEEEAPTAGSPLRTKANSLLSEEVESQAEHTLFPFPSHQSGAQGLMSPWNTQEPAGPSTVTVSAPGVRAAAVRTPSLGRLSVNQTAWSSSGSASASGTDGALQTPSPALGTPVGPGPRTVAPLGRSTVSPSGMGVGTHAPLPPPTDPVSPDPRTPLGRPAAPSFGHPLASGAQDPLHPSPASPDRKPPVGRQQPVAANAGSADLPSVHGERDSSESTSIAAGVPIRVPPTVEHSGDPPPSENASVVSQPLTIHPALTGRAPPPTRSMSAAAAAPAPTPTPVAVPLQVTEERTPRMMDSSLSIRVTATSDGGASLSQHDAAVMEPNEQTQDRSTLHLASPDPHTPLSRPAMVGQPQGPMTSPDPRTPLGRPAGLLQGSAVPTMSSPEPRTPGAPSMGQAQRGAVPTMSSPEPRTPLGRPGAPSMGHPQGRAQPLSVHMACPEPRPPLGPGAPSMGQPQDSALHVSSPLVHPTVEPQQGSTRPASGLLSSPELHTPLGRSGPQASVHASASFMSSPEPRTPLGRPDAPSMGQPQANAVLLPVVSSSDPQTPPRSELVSSSACAQAQQSMSVASTSPDVTQAQSMSSPDVTRGSARPLAVGVGPRAGSDTGVSRSGAHIAQESNSMGTPHGTRSPVSSPYGPPQPFSVIGTLSPAVASPSHTQAPFMGHHLPTTEPGQSSEMHLHPESSPHLSIHVPGSEQPRPRTPLSRPDPLLRNGGSPWIGTPEQGQEGVGSQLQGNRIGSSPRGDLNEAGQEVVVGHGEGRYRVRSPKAGSSGNLYTPQSTSFNESQTAFFSPQPPHISPQRSGDALGKSSSVHRMIGNQVSPSNSSGHQNAAKFPVMSRTPFREESIASLRSANESLKTELQRSVDQCQTLIGERDLLMQQKSELEQQLTLIREQHGDSSTAIHTLTSRCTQLTAQISMLQNEITELNRTHQRQHDEFQGVVQQACQESELLQHQKAHLE